MKGILFGLGAAALYAAVVMMNKKLPGIDPYEKTVIQLLSAAGVLVPYLLIVREPMPASWSVTEGLMLAVVGVVHTGLAYALYFGSMDGLRAQTVAIISYLDPIVALLLSALILKEGLTLTGVLGAVMILGAAFVSEMSGKKTA
jgi:drug/metabolite transporter (DMT)-like permease